MTMRAADRSRSASSPISRCLSGDYLAVPVEEIDRIRSLLTMIGGRIVYAAEPYGELEAKGSAD